MTKETKIILAWELYQSGVSHTKIAVDLNHHRETIGIWLKGIKELGLSQFIENYLQAKKGPRKGRQIDPLIKKWIWDIREQERDCCGQKIQYFLKQDKNIHVSVPKIYEILAEKYQLKSKWKKNQKRGPVPVADNKRQVVQMDTVDFGELFAFTAVDIFSKETDVLSLPSLTAIDGRLFLHTTMRRRFDGFAELIQTDGGPEFKAEFHLDTKLFTNRHRLAKPYKKNEQSYIESFNRSLRKECLGWSKYKVNQLPELNAEVEKYLNWYHYRRPHLGLNLKTPLSI